MRRTLKVRETAAALRRMLAEEARRPGGPMVSVRGLATRLGASYSTVRRAVRILANEGQLRPEQGRGTFVAAVPTAAPAAGSAPRPAFSRKIYALAFGGPIRSWADGGFYRALFESASETILEAGDALLVTSAPPGNMPSFPAPEELLRLGVAGVLLCGGIFVASEQRRFAESKLPALLLDDVPQVRGLDYVLAGNRAGAEAIVSRLARWGHRRFAFIRNVVSYDGHGGELRPDADSAERARFVHAALRKRGLALHATIDNYAGRASKREAAARQLLALSPRPSAVICSGEDRAVTLLRLLRAQRVEVPGEISVAAFCGPAEVAPEMAGVEIGFDEMARLGVARLRARAEDRVPRGAPRRILAPVVLREGNTWGPAPR